MNAEDFYKKEYLPVNEGADYMKLELYTAADMIEIAENYHKSKVEKLPLTSVIKNEVSVCQSCKGKGMIYGKNKLNGHYCYVCKGTGQTAL